MNRQNGKTTTSLSSKALKVQIKRSHSSPTHDPFNFPAAIIPSQSEIPKKATVTVSPESTSLSLVIQNKKNSISAQYNNKRRINSKLADLTHSLRPSISSSITQDRSTSLRMSASSRFGKNLLPAWLGGHQSTGMLEPSFSDTTSNYSTSIDSSELDTTFERLLVMKIFKKERRKKNKKFNELHEKNARNILI
jgi:hypothetical protein